MFFRSSVLLHHPNLFLCFFPFLCFIFLFSKQALRGCIFTHGPLLGFSLASKTQDNILLLLKKTQDNILLFTSRITATDVVIVKKQSNSITNHIHPYISLIDSKPISNSFLSKPLALFGHSQIRINPHVLGWIAVEFKLNFTLICPNTCGLTD